MMALTHVRGQEAKTFSALSKFVKEDVDRTTAIRAMQRLPKASWPKEDAAPLLGVLIASIQKIPAAERTSPAALDALENIVVHEQWPAWMFAGRGKREMAQRHFEVGAAALPGWYRGRRK